MPFTLQALTLSPELQFCMNLIVDIGNSTAKAAVFDGERMIVRKRLSASYADGLAMLAEGFSIQACAYSCVGPEQPDVEAMLHHLSPKKLLCVVGNTPTPLVMDYHTPGTLGSDRLAAAVGAATICTHSDLLVIDAGTCITYDFVSADGHYQGGAISPGLGMRMRALHDQTARLPLVTTEGENPLVGYDTMTAIRGGALHGMAFEIEGYIAHFQRLHPTSKVFLTGGNAHRFAQEMDVERNDSLVEIGLNRILDYATS